MARKKRGSAAARAAAAKRASLKSSQKKQDKQEEAPEVPDVDEDETMDETSTTISGEVEGEGSETTEEVPNAPPEVAAASQDEEGEVKIESPEEPETPEVTPEDPPPEEPGTSPAPEGAEDVKVAVEDIPPSAPAPEPVPSTSSQMCEMKPLVEEDDLNELPPSTIGERDFYVDTLLTDKDYLVDVSLGYAPVTNLKQPLKCFTATDELQLFPVIESMSAKLYTIVQKMNACQKRDVEAAIKAKKGIIKFPASSIRSYLCHINSMEPPRAEEDKGSPQGSVGSQTKRAPHPFLLTEDENMFSEEKLKMLRSVLDAGWKREVVMRSPGSTGRKTGDVYYYSPDGTKFRSSKQVEKHLQDLQDTPFTIENFTFAKVRISTNPEQEIVRKAYDGKSPPRAPPKPSSSKAKSSAGSSSSAASSSRGAGGSGGARASTSAAAMMEMEEPLVKQGYTGRRAIQPPKRYSGDAVLLLSKRSKIQDDRNRNANANKGLMQMGMLPPKYPKGMEDSSSKLPEGMDLADLGYMIDDEDSSGSNSVAMKEIAEDSLFQISALRQSGGIDVDNMQQLVESQKQLSHKAQHVAQRDGGGHAKAGTSKRGGNTVIPCSIRCPGMEGAVPNLNCSRCLCLFHAECLGLPPNLAFNKYLCSNCTDQHSSGAPSSSSAAASSQQKSIMMMKKAPGGGGEVGQKRSPPGLAPIAHGNLRGAPVPPPTRGDITVTMTGGKDGGIGHGGHMSRIPQGKMVAVARGMIRNRGMPPPPSRAPPMHRQMAMMEDGGGGRGHHPQQHHPHQQMMKRGRGRPPSVPPQQQQHHHHHPQHPHPHHQSARSLPQLSKNLTITHLPRIGSGPPSLPSLQSKALSHQKAKIPLPITMAVGGKPRQAVIPTVPKLMKSSAFRLAVPPPSLSGRTFKKTIPTPTPPTNLRLASGGGGGGKGGVVYSHGTPHQDKLPHGTTVVKRYPQSVCTIGNKKFVVLPKRRAADFVPAAVVPQPPSSAQGVAIGNGGFPKGITVTEANTVKIENNGGGVTLKKVGCGGGNGTSELTQNNSDNGGVGGVEGGEGKDNLMTDELMDGVDDGGSGEMGENVEMGEGDGDEASTPMEEGEDQGAGGGAILNNSSSAVGEPISANQ